MENYEVYMKRCIELARQGQGNTSPNPMVGCVVLNKNEKIIAEGYHAKYGENHAERDALLKLKNGEEKNGTLIVNLEPCSHYGKTPPCADLIIERGLKKVVIGCKDNNPKVNGGGIKKLSEAGIEVITGVLEEECRKLNEIFFTNVEQNRIFTALKTATTIDGKIATSTGNSKWITSDDARQKARSLRWYYDAILTSADTVLTDNPTMEHKIKIILDKHSKINVNDDLNILKSGKIYLICPPNTHPKPEKDNIKIIHQELSDNGFSLKKLLTTLYAKENIKSVFVEAGGSLSGSFIKENLADKIYHFIAPKILNDNSGVSCFSGDNISLISDAKRYKTDTCSQIGNDILVVYSKDKE